jgi:hypothetical protein
VTTVTTAQAAVKSGEAMRAGPDRPAPSTATSATTSGVTAIDVSSAV